VTRTIYGLNRAAFARLIDASQKKSGHNLRIPIPTRHPRLRQPAFLFEYHAISEIFHSIHEPNDLGVRVYMSTTPSISPLHHVHRQLSRNDPSAAFLCKEGLQVPSARALILFFAALGLDSCSLNWVSFNPSILFGHPMYSLALVLAGLLFLPVSAGYMAGMRTVPVSR